MVCAICLGTPTATAASMNASQMTAKNAGVEPPTAAAAPTNFGGMRTVSPTCEKIASAASMHQSGMAGSDASNTINPSPTWAAMFRSVRRAEARCYSFLSSVEALPHSSVSICCRVHPASMLMTSFSLLESASAIPYSFKAPFTSTGSTASTAMSGICTAAALLIRDTTTLSLCS
jgi:hypothetical protein